MIRGCAARWSFGGEAALSVEARYLEPELPDELDDAYAQTFDRLRRMFRARGCSAEESADLAQEAAIRAFMHIRRWGVTGAGLNPLLNRIARNLLIDRYRRAVPHIVPLDSADEIHDPTQDPSEEFARRHRRSAVQSAIRSLPARHAKAITYSLSGLTPEEVGKQLGIGRNAADALLHRARRSLREHLAPVRDGMWGLAFGIKIRFDRVARRVGLSGAATDASVVVSANSVVGVTAAAIVAVLAFTGGGATTPTLAGTSSSAVSERGSALILDGTSLGSGTGSTASGGGVAGGSGSGRMQYGSANLGGTWGRDGIGAQARVPSPKDKDKDLFGLDLGMERDPGSPSLEHWLDEQAQRACRLRPRACLGQAANQEAPR